ncbi:MAG: hypothetical protein KDA42_16040 [Planctomycetales bacterium]|nr:hypothetical protein [Planctomycetales bacterium]
MLAIAGWGAAVDILSADEVAHWTARGSRPNAAVSPDDRASQRVQLRLASKATGSNHSTASATETRLRWKSVAPKTNTATRIAITPRDSGVIQASAEIELLQAEEPAAPSNQPTIQDDGFFERGRRPKSLRERLDELDLPIDNSQFRGDTPVEAPVEPPTAAPAEQPVPDLFPPDEPTESEPVEQPASPEQLPEMPIESPSEPSIPQVLPPRNSGNSSLERRRQDIVEECETSIADLRSERLADWGRDKLAIDIDGIPGEDYPFECQRPDVMFAGRNWCELTFLWKASALCHKPLYFEDKQLERYGHEHGPFTQPIISGAHFFATLPILPYKMGLRPPTECVYALGQYRPGNCAPYMIEPLGFTWRAGLYEAGAWVAGAAIIP